MSAPQQTRRQHLAQIHTAKRDLALDDDDYRTLLERTTGKRSSALLSSAERVMMIAELRRLGWEPASRESRRWYPREKRADLRYVLVLWRLLAEAGVVDRSRKALNAFIVNPRFTQKWCGAVTDVHFLDSERAHDVIEALKQMCARHGVEIEGG